MKFIIPDNTARNADVPSVSRLAAGRLTMFRPREKIPPTMGCIITNLAGRWPKGVMPFAFDKTFHNKDRVLTLVNDAIKHWNDRTRNLPVMLVPHQHEVDFVQFTMNPIPDIGGPTTNTHESSASQFLGRHPGLQLIFCSDSKDLQMGSIVHEIGHAFGLCHEQNREDRNDHVVIHWDNIPKEERSQFERHPNANDDNGPYDFGSIMHYQPNAYAIDSNKPTITPSTAIPAGVTMGQRTGLSAGDVAAIRFLYRTITISVPPVTVDPPPITIMPPSMTVTPPPLTVRPPRMRVTPPSITVLGRTVTPPAFDVDPPEVTVTPPTLIVKPPAVTVDPPPVTFTPPPVTI